MLTLFHQVHVTGVSGGRCTIQRPKMWNLQRQGHKKETETETHAVWGISYGLVCCDKNSECIFVYFPVIIIHCMYIKLFIKRAITRAFSCWFTLKCKMRMIPKSPLWWNRNTACHAHTFVCFYIYLHLNWISDCGKDQMNLCWNCNFVFESYISLLCSCINCSSSASKYRLFCSFVVFGRWRKALAAIGFSPTHH